MESWGIFIILSPFHRKLNYFLKKILQIFAFLLGKLNHFKVIYMSIVKKKNIYVFCAHL